MLSFLPAPLLGTLTFSFYVMNSLFWLVPVYTLGLLKLLLPIPFLLRYFERILNFCGTAWVTVNSWNLLLTQKIKWHITGLEVASSLSTDQWYMVLCNHQSWVDILVLQKILNRRIPFLKFFLKSELIWVPFLGAAWWALDFPFMQRYSAATLKKHPEKKGKDKETTRKACEKFKHIPISLVSFVEGTRFTEAKHLAQQSPYQYLLKPRAGAVGYSMTIMGELMHKIVDVAIVYPKKSPTYWEFMSGKISDVYVHIDVLDVTDELQGDYFDSPDYRSRLQSWLNQRWQEKASRIADLQKEGL